VEPEEKHKESNALKFTKSFGASSDDGGVGIGMSDRDSNIISPGQQTQSNDQTDIYR
jgi:type 1 fimbria pilin